jgi:tetratricopeptide (TPR) repeat protein
MLTLPIGQQLGRGMAFNALAIDDLQPPPSSALEQVSARFLGALEQLEKRVRELEVEPAVFSASATPASPGNGNPRTDPISTPASMPSGMRPEGSPPSGPPPSANSTPNMDKENDSDSARRIQQLLEEGEAFLQADRYEDALRRFDEALTIEARNSDALIKRGMALERLQRLEDALESYDRAIATNGSLTLAYLHKGAVCNRLQRYREALECYERALQAEQKF